MAYLITDLDQIRKYANLWKTAREAMGEGRDNPTVGLFSQLYAFVSPHFPSNWLILLR